MSSLALKAGAAGSMTFAAGLVTVAAAGPAAAAAACPSPATEIAPGVCGVTMTADGTFTAPDGVTTLEALLVGGGGAGNLLGGSYAGGLSGEATYVTGVATSAPIAVQIGAGGIVDAVAPTLVTAPDPRDGGDTSITDANGTDTAVGGTRADGGAETGGTASQYVSDSSGTVALWPAYSGEPCFADDGEDGDISAGPFATATLSCGGGAMGDGVQDAVAGTGSGGAGWFSDSNTSTNYPGGDGASGMVMFRYPLAEVSSGTGADEELADTGAANGGLAAGAAAAIALGAGLLAASRRRSA